MQQVNILHIADVHLGSVFTGLSYDDAKSRRSEAVYTFLKVMENAKDCDLVLMPGDIFNSGLVSVTLLDSFLNAVKNLGDIPVFFACGNHDSYYTDAIKYCLENSPGNLHIFPPDKLSEFTLEGLKVRIYGASFSSEHCNYSMYDSSIVYDKDYINILCMHCDVSVGKYNYLNINDLKASELSYAALGHIHTYSRINKAGNCSWAYSGITEGRGFDECGDKGYIKGTVCRSDTELEFYTASKRKYIDEKIDVTDFKNEYELVDIINSFCPEHTEICRFSLIGENNFLKQIDLNFLKSECTALSAEFTDLTNSAVYPENFADETGLLGACARECLKRINESESLYEKEKVKKSFSLLAELFELK